MKLWLFAASLILSNIFPFKESVFCPLIKVQRRESDENLILSCICPLCVAVVDKDQTVNPCVSVPDSALHVWPGGAKISNTLCYHLHLCANTIIWKLPVERNLRAECLSISTEAWVPQSRKRAGVCGWAWPGRVLQHLSPPSKIKVEKRT